MDANAEGWCRTFRTLEGMTFSVACLIDTRSMFLRDLERKLMTDIEEWLERYVANTRIEGVPTREWAEVTGLGVA